MMSLGTWSIWSIWSMSDALDGLELFDLCDGDGFLAFPFWVWKTCEFVFFPAMATVVVELEFI